VTPTELVAHTRRRGVELLTAADRLGYRAPVGVVDATLVSALTMYKPQILAILASGRLPCPRCTRPLDAFQCCWACPGRLCQACGAWMAQRAYATTCEPCLTARFARLDAERAQPRAIQEPDVRLHPCPACTVRGRMKLIPRLWAACAVCDPGWRG
jgi:hypothetical protein